MNSELLKLTNIGKNSVEKLNYVGIFSIDEFMSYDPYVLFDIMFEKLNPTLPSPMLSSLVGAKSGIPWYELNEFCKKEYQKRHPKHRWHKYYK